MLKPKEQPDCEEEGIVVVSITVDKTGKVIRAVAGVKGTTNTAACLLKPAKEAALKNNLEFRFQGSLYTNRNYHL